MIKQTINYHKNFQLFTNLSDVLLHVFIVAHVELLYD